MNNKWFTTIIRCGDFADGFPDPVEIDAWQIHTVMKDEYLVWDVLVYEDGAWRYAYPNDTSLVDIADMEGFYWYAQPDACAIERSVND